jgi:hypothetical protein
VELGIQRHHGQAGVQDISDRRSGEVWVPRAFEYDVTLLDQGAEIVHELIEVRKIATPLQGAPGQDPTQTVSGSAQQLPYEMSRDESGPDDTNSNRLSIAKRTHDLSFHC